MKKLIMIFAFLSVISCSKNDVDYDAKNDKDIKAYLEKNNIDAEKSESGLYYIIEKQGSGDYPNRNSSVTVRYKGYFLDGKGFDKSKDEGITFPLTGVIPGWTEGLQYFKKGGSGKLFIPSKLGYGSNDYSTIPGGSVLIFDVKLLEVR